MDCLQLLFVKGGSHGWRFDCRIDGKRKMLSLGTYLDTSLAAARRNAEAVREWVAEGFDPSKKRQAEKAAYLQARAVEVRREQGLPPLDSFEATAREWFAVKRGGWAPSYADKIIARLEADVFPWIGQATVAGITPPPLLDVLRRIESRGVVETAHRALENCSQVFRQAVATGKPCSSTARGLPAVCDPWDHPQPLHRGQLNSTGLAALKGRFNRTR